MFPQWILRAKTREKNGRVSTSSSFIMSIINLIVLSMRIQYVAMAAAFVLRFFLLVFVRNLCIFFNVGFQHWNNLPGLCILCPWELRGIFISLIKMDRLRNVFFKCFYFEISSLILASWRQWSRSKALHIEFQHYFHEFLHKNID